MKPYVPSRWKRGRQSGGECGGIDKALSLLGLTMLAAFYGFVTMLIT